MTRGVGHDERSRIARKETRLMGRIAEAFERDIKSDGVGLVAVDDEEGERAVGIALDGGDVEIGNGVCKFGRITRAVDR